MPKTLLAIALGALIVGCDRPNVVVQRPWDPLTRVFRWRTGQVQLPEGYSYRPAGGSCSYIGFFDSVAGESEIVHDIGNSAGFRVLEPSAQLLERRGFFSSRVWITCTNWGFAVSFPDNDGANFCVTTPAEVIPEELRELAATFKPRGWRRWLRF